MVCNYPDFHFIALKIIPLHDAKCSEGSYLLLSTDSDSLGVFLPYSAEMCRHYNCLESIILTSGNKTLLVSKTRHIGLGLFTEANKSSNNLEIGSLKVPHMFCGL